MTSYAARLSFLLSLALAAGGILAVPAHAQYASQELAATSTTAATTTIPGTIYSTPTTPGTLATVLIALSVLLLAGAGLYLLSVNPLRLLTYLHLEDLWHAAS